MFHVVGKRSVKMIFIAVVVVIGATAPAPVRGQDPHPACGEALDTASVTLGGHVLSVCYPRRAARGRPVFGYPLTFTDSRWLVPFDTLWRTGIILRVPVAVEAAGVSLAPGSYAIYAVPSSVDWIVIFNTDTTDLSSDVAYDAIATQEAGRGIARAMANDEYVEWMRLSGEASGDASAALTLAWERMRVHIPIRLTETRGMLGCWFRGPAEALGRRPSPLDSVDLVLGGQHAKLCYGRPSARARIVFGGVVPYNDLWRLGANEPTTLHIPFGATVAGIPIDAGDYAILTVPSRGSWAIVVTASTNQWGRVETTERGGRSQYTDDVRAREEGRAMVPSERTTEHVETLTIRSVPAGPAGVDLVVAWERTQVRIPVRRR
jgi:Protein of unknown function (DUF2911)